MGFPKTKFIQRQQSPVLVRHVLTSNQGIPVSMALLQSNNQQNHSITVQSQQTESLPAGTAIINNVGQYVLVQQNSTPRASSAPPAQNQVIVCINFFSILFNILLVFYYSLNMKFCMYLILIIIFRFSKYMV